MSTIPADLDKEIIKIGDKLHSAVEQVQEDDVYFGDISDAIVAKDGGEPPEKEDMATRIEALPTNLIPKTITENGVYNASSDNADGYSSVEVNVADKWELLNEVTLDADVSIIKIDISTYKNDYSAFLVAPQLTPSQYTEWFYCGFEAFNGAYFKGGYTVAGLATGAFEYPKYFCYGSRNLDVIIPNSLGVTQNHASNIFKNIAYIVLSLYETQSTFLSGGSYKLYGKKTEDYLNVN